jgi:hypothetical protein
MRHHLLVAFVLLCGTPSSPAFGAARITLVDDLGEDQSSERVTVWIDDVAVGELALDRRQPRASLVLPLSKPVHRYRLAGETTIEGTRFRLEGAGLIVTTDRMDDIAERTPNAAAAVEAYRALVAEIRAAAPAADLSSLDLVIGPRATKGAVLLAQERLGMTLPEAYRRLVTEVGPFTLGPPDALTGAVLAPEALATAMGFYLARMRDDGWDDLDETEQTIRKRFPKATRDVVIDWFELDEPTVLVAGERCPRGETGFALPGSDFDLLGTESGDNELLDLIDYDYIMGEPDCMAYDRLLAYSLHDHLLEMGDPALFVRDDETETLELFRQEIDEDGKRIWLGIGEGD